MELKFDNNWMTPAALAKELGVARSTVSSWIFRNQITYKVLPGATHRRHVVDKRTAPIVRAAGRPKK